MQQQRNEHHGDYEPQHWPCIGSSCFVGMKKIDLFFCCHVSHLVPLRKSNNVPLTPLVNYDSRHARHGTRDPLDKNSMEFPTTRELSNFRRRRGRVWDVSIL